MKNMLNFLSDEELVALKEWLSQDKKDTSAIISKKLQQLVIESTMNESTIEMINAEIHDRKVKNTGDFKYLEEVRKIKDKIEMRDISLENATFRSSIWKDVENIDPNLPGYLITPSGDCIPVVEGITHIKAMKNVLEKCDPKKYGKTMRFDLTWLAFLATGSVLYVGVRRKGPLDSLELYRGTNVYFHFPYKNGINLPVTSAQKEVMEQLKKNNDHNFIFHEVYVDADPYVEEVQKENGPHHK